MQSLAPQPPTNLPALLHVTHSVKLPSQYYHRHRHHHMKIDCIISTKILHASSNFATLKLNHHQEYQPHHHPHYPSWPIHWLTLVVPVSQLPKDLSLHCIVVTAPTHMTLLFLFPSGPICGRSLATCIFMLSKLQSLCYTIVYHKPQLFIISWLLIQLLIFEMKVSSSSFFFNQYPLWESSLSILLYFSESDLPLHQIF